MPIRYFFACLALIGSVACDSGVSDADHKGPQLSIAVHLARPNVASGDTVRYAFEARDPNGQLLPADGFTFRLSNESVARFDASEPLVIGVRQGALTLTAIAKSDTTQRGSAALNVLPGAPAFDWSLPAYRWSEEPAAGTAVGIWGSSSHDVYAASTLGIAHYDGSSWSLVRPFVRDSGSHSVAGSGPNDVYVGSNRGMYHYDGTAWSWIGIPDSSSFVLGTIRELWAVGPADVFGNIDGQVWRYRNGQWQRIFAGGPGAWNGLTGSSASNLFLTDSYNSEVLHWDGAAWHSIGSPAGMRFVGATWMSAADLYLAGTTDDPVSGNYKSAVARYHAGSWTSLPGDSAQTMLRAIHGAGDNAIVAVGDNGVARYFDGTAFHTVWLGTRVNFLDVWMDSTDVFITTPDGRILHGRRE